MSGGERAKGERLRAKGTRRKGNGKRVKTLLFTSKKKLLSLRR